MVSSIRHALFAAATTGWSDRHVLRSLVAMRIGVAFVTSAFIYVSPNGCRTDSGVARLNLANHAVGLRTNMNRDPRYFHYIPYGASPGRCILELSADIVGERRVSHCLRPVER
jgi:hypothetical protein